MSKAHWHANVADAPVQQQGGQVWRRLSWSCPCTCCHPSGHTLVGVHLISHIKSFRPEQLLCGRKILRLLLLPSSAAQRRQSHVTGYNAQQGPPLLPSTPSSSLPCMTVRPPFTKRCLLCLVRTGSCGPARCTTSGSVMPMAAICLVDRP